VEKVGIAATLVAESGALHPGELQLHSPLLLILQQLGRVESTR
jgi:hypothetical protein